MVTRKHNEFLDLDESENEVSDGYQSEAQEESRGKIASSRSAKRRKVDTQSDDSDDGDDDVEDVSSKLVKALSKGKSAAPKADSRFAKLQEFEDEGDKEHGTEEDELEAEDGEEDADPTAPSEKAGRTAPKSVLRAEKAARKSGVVYISRVPPFMKPHTLKHFLEEHAPKGLGRIFLTPEDHTRYLQRKKSGGNKSRGVDPQWQHHGREEGQLLPRRSVEYEVLEGLQVEPSDRANCCGECGARGQVEGGDSTDEEGE
jgi:ESF2/ABP1 family protein